jgi:hypothetical protein
MKNPWLKKLLPHLVAIVLFLVVSAVFCRPALEGNVLNQHDNIGWKGMAQNAFEYKKVHGHFPLWNPNLFSGMPNYQVALEGKSVMPNFINILSLGLPKPLNFFFLACICFYILCLALRVNPIVGMLGALAYAFSTYNAVIVFAGHDTQMLATAFMPLLLAGLILTYEKKYWLGLAVTCFAAYHQLGVNHLQVTYYFFLIAVLVTLGYLVKWIMDKDWKHIGISAAIVLVSAVLAVAGNALVLKTTSEYSKFTMRNGKDIEIEGDSVTIKKTKGLDTSYAFEYSLGKSESLTFLMPEAFGGGGTKMAGEKSNIVKKLTARGIDENSALQVAENTPRYWGGLPYTAGPAYLGVIICIMGLIGFVTLKTPLRWGLLAVTVLSILMSWGKHFAGFNVFLFENLPLYNKFRSPSFAQVIPQLAMGVMAVLALQQVFYATKSREWLQANFKKMLYALAGLFGLVILVWLSMDYSSSIDPKLVAGYTRDGSDEMGRLIVSALKKDRSGMFAGQLVRAIILAAVTIGIIWLWLKNKINSLVAMIILLLVSTVEIVIESKGYLNEDSYVPADDYSNLNFAPTSIDQQILQDKDPNFRVFNLAEDTYNDSRTSYYHKSIGGYHPAKLRTYQDMIEKYLSNPPNPAIVNMLNAKYVIIQNPQNGQPVLLPNPDALGNCWFVKHVLLVGGRAEAIKTIGKVNLRDTAVVESSLATGLAQPQWDSAATIRMTKFDNDAIEYESNAAAQQFAVFSEVYYPKGWNAYIDGKKTVYYNTNYILRGLSVPAGKHTIRFVFEPESVKTGKSMMYMASIVILLVFLGGLFMAWRQGRKKTA